MEIINGQLIIDGIVSADLPKLAHAATVNVWRVPLDYRADGLFIAVAMPGNTEEVPACDSATVEYLGVLDLPADDAKKLEAAKIDAIYKINAACASDLVTFSSAYPPSEVQSWPQQVKEAEAFIADPAAPTPLLSAISGERLIAIADLAALVIAKMTAYSGATGFIIGRRQALEKVIEVATSQEEIDLIAW